MAEARQAVAPVPALGLHTYRVDTSQRTLQMAMTEDGFVFYVPHMRFLLRSLVRAFHRGRNNVASALWPARLRWVFVLNCGVIWWVLRQPGDHWVRSGRAATLLWDLDSLQPWAPPLPVWFRVSALCASFLLPVHPLPPPPPPSPPTHNCQLQGSQIGEWSGSNVDHHVQQYGTS